jgi:hypothetical protein
MREATLGKRRSCGPNPNGVAPVFKKFRGHNPVGLGDLLPAITQGSSFLPTLDFETKSLLGLPIVPPIFRRFVAIIFKKITST